TLHTHSFYKPTPPPPHPHPLPLHDALPIYPPADPAGRRETDTKDETAGPPRPTRPGQMAAPNDSAHPRQSPEYPASDAPNTAACGRNGSGNTPATGHHRECRGKPFPAAPPAL